MVLCQHFSICAEVLLVVQDMLLQTPFFLLAVLVGFHRAPILIKMISNRLKQQANPVDLNIDLLVKSEEDNNNNNTPLNTETNGMINGVYTVPVSDEDEQQENAVYIEWEDSYLSDLKYRLYLWIQIFNVFINIPFNFLLLLG
jgi:hypothetical protein